VLKRKRLRLPDQISTSPCDSCAFTPGAEANSEPHNNLRGQLCLLGGLVFYCHHDRAGALQDLKGMRMAERGALVREGKLVVCQGWRREVQALAQAGYYLENQAIKRMYAELGLGALLISPARPRGWRRSGRATFSMTSSWRSTKRADLRRLSNESEIVRYDLGPQLSLKLRKGRGNLRKTAYER
jgi:hypothetical protein